jgi:hypothetical protein
MQHAPVEFTVGSRGWRHSHWVGGFYPDDMPQDWWLSYYSNEFRSVLIPWNYLQEADASTAQQWKTDVHDEFKFFIELSPDISVDRISRLLQPLAPQLGGVILQERNWDDVLIKKAQLNEVIKTIIDIAPVALAKQYMSKNILTALERYQLGCYWQPETDSLNECDGVLNIAEITQAVNHDPKTLKKIIEHCYSIQGPTTISLVFGGNAPNIEEMRTATMINQMLV